MSVTKGAENPLYGAQMEVSQHQTDKDHVDCNRSCSPLYETPMGVSQHQTNEDHIALAGYKLYPNTLYSSRERSGQVDVLTTKNSTINPDSNSSVAFTKGSHRFQLLTLLLSVVALVGVVVAIALILTTSRSNCDCPTTTNCMEPECPDNADCRPRGDKQYPSGTLIIYGCAKGNRLEGYSSIQCLGNGSWTSKPPVCVSDRESVCVGCDPRVRLFDISNPLEWASAPNYSGRAFVNGQYTPIAHSEEQNKLCYYPWGITHLFEIDDKKMYEFSVWILSTASDLDNFLGFQVYDSNRALLVANTTDKPYFKRTDSDTKEWTRQNGFILPAKYSPDYMPSYFSNGKNWQWPYGSKYVQLRFGTCYGNGDNTGKSYFALPQVVESDLQP